MEEVIVLSSDNEDSSSSSSSPSSASDMEIDPIEIEHNTTEQFVPKDNQTLEKIYIKTVIPLSAFLEPMTDFQHWENMKYNNYRKARVHTTINQIYGNPNEQRNYRDLKARVNLKSVKRNSNTSVLSGVASVIDPCELNSGDFRGRKKKFNYISTIPEKIAGLRDYLYFPITQNSVNALTFSEGSEMVFMFFFPPGSNSTRYCLVVRCQNMVD
uniref:Uncharacterized protein n=1 Tax=Glossina austeni TaxID=7395 RepID=A0A1A9VI28_GLOAU